VYKNIHDRDYFRLETSDQTYCEDDKLFLADRFVEGTCPTCDYDVSCTPPGRYMGNSSQARTPGETSAINAD
jgi:methionyl-tRNA synthetase